MGTYRMLDLLPEGRGERDVPNKMEWVRHHDRYDARTGGRRVLRREGLSPGSTIRTSAPWKTCGPGWRSPASAPCTA